MGHLSQKAAPPDFFLAIPIVSSYNIRYMRNINREEGKMFFSRRSDDAKIKHHFKRGGICLVGARTCAILRGTCAHLRGTFGHFYALDAGLFTPKTAFSVAPAAFLARFIFLSIDRMLTLLFPALFPARSPPHPSFTTPFPSLACPPPLDYSKRLDFAGNVPYCRRKGSECQRLIS